MARKAKEVPHLRLRVEAALLSRLQKSAEKNGRTLTGEIVHRLEGSFNQNDREEWLADQIEKIRDGLRDVISRVQAGVEEERSRVQAGGEQER